MQTWCLVTSFPNWERFHERQTWSFDRATRMRDVKSGDEAAVYLTQDRGYSSFVAVVRFLASQSRLASTPSGISRVYQHEVPIETLIQVRSPIPVELVRDELGFLPKERHWGLALQGRAIRSIPNSDFLMLKERLGARARAEVPFSRRDLARVRPKAD